MGKKSLFFDDDEIIEHPSYKDAVDPDVFLDKIREMCTYEQDYTHTQAVTLEDAEEILLFIRALRRR